jgi:uncharacterized repeat protein (TIGR01451 family)
VIYGPANLTNNATWGDGDDLNVPLFYRPRIAATDDNRFVMAWERSYTGTPSGGCSSDCWVNDIDYAIRSTDGGVIKPVTQFTDDTPGWEEGYRFPALAQLSNNRVLLVWHRDSDDYLYYAVLDSADNIVKAKTSTETYGWFPDATQLSDGRIVIAWGGDVRFVVLDAAYDLVAGPVVLSNPAAATGDDDVSVAADSEGNAILTWTDFDASYRRNLYYALVDGNGNILTNPLIFRTSQATDPYIDTNYEGYGNTSYSWTPPSGVDGTATFGDSFFGGAPGGNAPMSVSYANHGATTATNVVLTATLDDDLTYVGDTSGIAPTVSGNQVIWNLPDLGFLDSQSFTMLVEVPSGAGYGSRYPVTLALSSDGPEASAGDNTDSTQVMAARQVFMPLTSGGD